MNRSAVRRMLWVVSAIAALSGAVTGCSSDGDGGGGSAGGVVGSGELAVQVASYEPVVGPAQRFLVGLVASGGRLVGYGQVRLSFRFEGARGSVTTAAGSSAGPAVAVEADYRLVAGQRAAADTTGPRFISGSEGVGVYGADVAFDRAGFWTVTVRAVIDGASKNVDASFEVYAKASIPFPGDAAPRTVSRLFGDPSVPAKSIDSRAAADGSIPDRQLHSVTLADAIAAKRPVMVVVSTPVYCVSRFCGPITETVEALAKRYGDRMAFIHAEVWHDYERSSLNKEAADWIYRSGVEPKEPWVFLVDAQGKVAQRWDNVSTDAELEAAVRSMVGE